MGEDGQDEKGPLVAEHAITCAKVWRRHLARGE